MAKRGIVCIMNTGSFLVKIRGADMANIAILNNIIPFEHERRFSLNVTDGEEEIVKMPFGFTRYVPTAIVQGYLDDPFKTRIRDECRNDEHVYTKTRKIGQDLSCRKDNHEVSKKEFDMLWEGVKYYLMKNRYSIPWFGTMIQLNTYHNDLAGYMQFEVEFDSQDDALAFNPPLWFGQEVTDNIRHEDYFLAKLGPPK